MFMFDLKKILFTIIILLSTLSGCSQLKCIEADIYKNLPPGYRVDFQIKSCIYGPGDMNMKCIESKADTALGALDEWARQITP